MFPKKAPDDDAASDMVPNMCTHPPLIKGSSGDLLDDVFFSWSWVMSGFLTVWVSVQRSFRRWDILGVVGQEAAFDLSCFETTQ